MTSNRERARQRASLFSGQENTDDEVGLAICNLAGIQHHRVQPSDNEAGMVADFVEYYLRSVGAKRGSPISIAAITDVYLQRMDMTFCTANDIANFLVECALEPKHIDVELEDSSVFYHDRHMSSFDDQLLKFADVFNAIVEVVTYVSHGAITEISYDDLGMIVSLLQPSSLLGAYFQGDKLTEFFSAFPSIFQIMPNRKVKLRYTPKNWVLLSYTMQCIRRHGRGAKIVDIQGVWKQCMPSSMKSRMNKGLGEFIRENNQVFRVSQSGQKVEVLAYRDIAGTLCDYVAENIQDFLELCGSCSRQDVSIILLLYYINNCMPEALVQFLAREYPGISCLELLSGYMNLIDFPTGTTCQLRNCHMFCNCRDPSPPEAKAFRFISMLLEQKPSLLMTMERMSAWFPPHIKATCVPILTFVERHSRYIHFDPATNLISRVETIPSVAQLVSVSNSPVTVTPDVPQPSATAPLLPETLPQTSIEHQRPVTLLESSVSSTAPLLRNSEHEGADFLESRQPGTSGFLSTLSQAVGSAFSALSVPPSHRSIENESMTSSSSQTSSQFSSTGTVAGYALLTSTCAQTDTMSILQPESISQATQVTGSLLNKESEATSGSRALKRSGSVTDSVKLLNCLISEAQSELARIQIVAKISSESHSGHLSLDISERFVEFVQNWLESVSVTPRQSRSVSSSSRQRCTSDISKDLDSLEQGISQLMKELKQPPKDDKQSESIPSTPATKTEIEDTSAVPNSSDASTGSLSTAQPLSSKISDALSISQNASPFTSVQHDPQPETTHTSIAAPSLQFSRAVFLSSSPPEQSIPKEPIVKPATTSLVYAAALSEKLKQDSVVPADDNGLSSMASFVRIESVDMRSLAANSIAPGTAKSGNAGNIDSRLKGMRSPVRSCDSDSDDAVVVDEDEIDRMDYSFLRTDDEAIIVYVKEKLDASPNGKMVLKEVLDNLCGQMPHLNQIEIFHIMKSRNEGYFDVNQRENVIVKL